jgi:hypothetical protein
MFGWDHHDLQWPTSLQFAEWWPLKFTRSSFECKQPTNQACFVCLVGNTYIFKEEMTLFDIAALPPIFQIIWSETANSLTKRKSAQTIMVGLYLQMIFSFWLIQHFFASTFSRALFREHFFASSKSQRQNVTRPIFGLQACGDKHPKWQSWGRQYQFFFDIISYQHHGPKSDILSCIYHFKKSDIW